MAIRDIASSRPTLQEKISRQIESESRKLEARLPGELPSIAQRGGVTLAQRFNGLSRPHYNSVDGSVTYRLASIWDFQASMDNDELIDIVKRSPAFKRLKRLCARPDIDVAIEASGDCSGLADVTGKSYPAVTIYLKQPYRR